MPFTLENGPADAAARLIIAHGAGAGITFSFLENIAHFLAERGIAVTRLEFAYMTARREQGTRRPPPRAQSLMGEFRQFVHHAFAAKPQRQTLLIGGKSLGGRVASMIADDSYAAGEIGGLVCLGYPFHPPKKPDALRTAHLETLACPSIIVQGERDPFGTREEVSRLALSPCIAFEWIGDGDHDLNPRGASGYTRSGNLIRAADAVAAFAARQAAAR